MSLSDIDNEIEEYLKDKNMHCLEWIRYLFRRLRDI
jgi:hypothetical protein